MNQEDLEYERKYSHSHCWNQGKNPACGQPLENHKQCCLCDTVYKPRKRFPSQPNSEDGKMMYGHSSGNEVQFSHSPKPEEKCPLGKGHKYSEICRVCTPLPDTTEKWEEDLYFEVVEDLIYYAKMFHLAKDEAKQTQNIRNQIRKLESFIKSLLSTAIKTREEEIEKAFIKVTDMCLLDSKVRIGESKPILNRTQFIELIKSLLSTS